MIILDRVSKAYGSDATRRVVFEDVDLEVPVNKRLALLGPQGSGKSTFINLLAGLDAPTSGQIKRHASISLPIGYNRGFMPALSARQNAAFFARGYGADVGEVISFVEEAIEAGPYFDQPLKKLPAGIRINFAAALSYAIPFDLYVMDERLLVGTVQFRPKCTAMLEERIKTAGILFATSNIAVARRYCDAALVIKDRKVMLLDDITDAVRLAKEFALPTAKGAAPPQPRPRV